MRRIVLLLTASLVIACCASGLSLAQLQDLSGSSATPEEPIAIGSPVPEDEICDDLDEQLDVELTCGVTKVTYDFDSPMRSATF